MHKLVIFLFLLFNVLKAEPQKVSLQKDIFLEQYKAFRFPTKTHQSIFIKNKILRIKNLKDAFQIIGFKTGITEMHYDNQIYKIQVLNSQNFFHLMKLKNWTEQHPSLKLVLENNSGQIKGQVLSLMDLSFILNWAEESDLKIDYHLDFTFLKKQKVLKLLSDFFNFRVIDYNSELKLKFASSTSDTLSKKLDHLNIQFFKKNNKSSSIGILKIFFVNLNKNYLDTLTPLLPSGFKWSLDQKIKILTEVYDFNHSIQDQISRKSSDVNLMLFNDEPTKYQSGGEFAIEQRDFQTSKISWKSYGLFIDAKAFEVSKSKVNLDLSFKLSHRVSSSNEQPELTHELWKQNFHLQKNKTYVVNNNFTHYISANKNEHLFLKQIPILNFLFYGRDRSKQDSEVFMLIKLITEE